MKNQMPLATKIETPDQSKFIDILGVQKINLSFNSAFVEDNQLNHNSWRKFSENAVSAVEVSIDGQYTASDSDKIIREYSFKQKKFRAMILFSDSYSLFGEFVIADLNVSMDKDDEKFDMILQSCSEIAYIKHDERKNLPNV